MANTTNTSAASSHLPINQRGNQNVAIQNSTTGPITITYQASAPCKIYYDNLQDTLPTKIQSIFLLLQAKYGLVDFIHRGTLLDDMLQWIDHDQSDEAIAIWCLYGHGGVGKTRFAREVLLQRQHTWAGGFIDCGRTKAEAFEHVTSNQLLLIYDYAESKYEKILEHIKMLEDTKQQYPQRRVRILLLSRQAGNDVEWFSLFNTQLDQIAAISRCTTNLDRQYTLTDQEYQTLYRNSQNKFAEFLANKANITTVQPTLLAPTLSEQPSFLSVIVQALLSILDNTTQQSDFSEDALLTRLLDYEKVLLSKHHKLTLQNANVVLQTMALLSLWGDVILPENPKEDPPFELQRLLPAGFSSENTVLVYQAIQNLYNISGKVYPLEPDRIAEHAIATYLVTHHKTQIHAILHDTQRYANALTILTRVLNHYSGDKYKHVTEWLQTFFADKFTKEHLEGVLKPAVEVASREMGWGLAEILLEQGKINEQSIDAVFANKLLAASPAKTTIFISWKVWLAERTLHRLDLLSDYKQAICLSNASTIFAEADQQKKALEMALQSKILLEKLVLNDESALPQLAMSLNNLSNIFSEFEQKAEALDAAQKAVTIYQTLILNNDNFCISLAMSLNNLGNAYDALNNKVEARNAMQDAVKRRKNLCNKQFSMSLFHDVAVSTSNLSSILMFFEEYTQALSLAQEACNIHESLAKKNPDAFLPDFASSLNTLGAVLSQIGRKNGWINFLKTAAFNIQKAITIYNGLVKNQPNVFLADLADAYNNFSQILHSLGNPIDAISAAQKAAHFYEHCTNQKPHRLPVALSQLHLNLGSWLWQIGNIEKACEETLKSIAIGRMFAQQNSCVCKSILACGLNNLGAISSMLKQNNEAFAATQEAVDIRRSLATKNPDAFLPDLAGSLNNLGAMLSELGQRNEALNAAKEAVDIYKILAKKNPDAFSVDLARACGPLTLALLADQQNQQAFDTSKEALLILKPYLQYSPVQQLFTALLRDYIRSRIALGLEPVDLPSFVQDFGEDALPYILQTLQAMMANSELDDESNDESDDTNDVFSPLRSAHAHCLELLEQKEHQQVLEIAQSVLEQTFQFMESIKQDDDLDAETQDALQTHAQEFFVEFVQIYAAAQQGLGIEILDESALSHTFDSALAAHIFHTRTQILEQGTTEYSKS